MTDSHYNITLPAYNETKGIDDAITAKNIILFVSAEALALFIVCVNSITIIVIRRTPSLHTLSNIYITSLAVCDFLVGLSLIPSSVFHIPYIRVHYFNQDIKLCILVFCVNFGLAATSTFQMTLIAIDRYVYIVHPYIYRKVVSRKLISIVLCGTWARGVIYAMIPLAIHNDPSVVPICDITLAMPIEYLGYTTATSYAVCVIIDVSMYTKILYAAYKHRRQVQFMPSTHTAELVDSISTIKFSDSSGSMDTQTSENSQPLGILLKLNFNQNTVNDTVVAAGRKHSCSVSTNHSARMKNVRFFLTVFDVYFVCVTPSVACMSIDYYTVVPAFVYNLFTLLAFMNSGMNFIILCVLNARFRTAMLTMLPCKKSSKTVTNSVEVVNMDNHCINTN